jgi:hypothetical protein
MDDADFNFQVPAIHGITTASSSNAQQHASLPLASATDVSDTPNASSNGRVAVTAEEVKIWNGITSYSKHVKAHAYAPCALPMDFWSAPQTLRCASCALLYEETRPVPVPTCMDAKTKTFEVIAITCSLSCCMRYSLTHKETSHTAASVRSLLWVMAYGWKPSVQPVLPAPERNCLPAFWTGRPSDPRCVVKEWRVVPKAWVLPDDWSFRWKSVRLYQILVPYTFTTKLESIHAAVDKAPSASFAASTTGSATSAAAAPVLSRSSSRVASSLSDAAATFSAAMPTSTTTTKARPLTLFDRMMLQKQHKDASALGDDNT